MEDSASLLRRPLLISAMVSAMRVTPRNSAKRRQRVSVSPGPGIGSPSARSKSVTRRARTISSPLPCLLIRSGAFLQVCELDRRSSDDRRELWKAGTGGIKRNDVVIIGAIDDSARSWMPILQLNRYII